METKSEGWCWEKKGRERDICIVAWASHGWAGAGAESEWRTGVFSYFSFYSFFFFFFLHSHTHHRLPFFFTFVRSFLLPYCLLYSCPLFVRTNIFFPFALVEEEEEEEEEPSGGRESEIEAWPRLDGRNWQEDTALHGSLARQSLAVNACRSFLPPYALLLLSV